MFSEDKFMDEIYLINKKSEIEIMALTNEFNTSSKLMSLTESESVVNRISEFIHKVMQAILDSIASVFDSLSNLFNKDGKISKDEYLRSRQGEMVFDYNIVKQQNYINSKAKEGKSLLDKLLKGESVHDKVVRYVNDVARTLESKDGRNKIYATAAPIVYGAHVDFKDTMEDIKSLQLGHKLSYSEGVNTNDIQNCINTIKALNGRANNLVGMYFKEYDKLDKIDKRKMKGMKVK